MRHGDEYGLSLLLAIAVAALLAASQPARAHDPTAHGHEMAGDGPSLEEARPRRTDSDGPDDALPIDIEITDDLHLVDHEGQPWTAEELEGGLSMIFFGYASCDGVCPMALPVMAEVTELLERDGQIVRPVLITIDPERDTPEFLAEQLSELHPRFLGLTGSEQVLEQAREMFGVARNTVFEDASGTVYRHGSFIFLVDAGLEVVSMLPPVLPPEEIAAIARKYL